MKVFYTDSEWDMLADLVFSMRLNNLDENLTTLVKRAMSNMHRKRPVNSAKDWPELMKRLIRRAEHTKQLPDKVKGLEASVANFRNQPLTPELREQAISNMSDLEIANRFKAKILAKVDIDDILSAMPVEILLDLIPFPDLAAFVARKQAELLNVKFNKINFAGGVEPTVTYASKVKVALVGGNERSASVVQREVGPGIEIVHIAQDEKQVSVSASVFIVWTRFVSHSMVAAVERINGAKIIKIHGGLTSVIQAVFDNAPKAD